MGTEDRAVTQAASEILRESVDELLVTFERQRAEMAEVQQRLATTTVTVWSSDNLVRVDANTAGIPMDVHLTAEAFKRSTPDKLGRSILEAVQNAARQAGELSQQAWAPVAALAGEVPDLPDIAPGMPSIKSLVDTLFPDPVTEPAPAEPLTEEEKTNTSAAAATWTVGNERTRGRRGSPAGGRARHRQGRRSGGRRGERGARGDQRRRRMLG